MGNVVMEELDVLKGFVDGWCEVADPLFGVVWVLKGFLQEAEESLGTWYCK